MKQRYINRYDDEYQFTLLENGDVLWQGPFKHYRYSKDENDNVSMIDPSGGPFIEKGDMLSHIIKSTEFNIIVEHFEIAEQGWLIKTKPHEYDPNDMSHLADLKIIGGIINTVEDGKEEENTKGKV